MAKRSGAVHVATTTRRYKGKVYRTHLLRRSFREGKSVKHETLGNLSHLPEHVIDLIRRSLRGEDLVPAGDAFQVESTLPHGHVAAVLGTLRELGLDRLLESRRSRRRDLVAAMVAARVCRPSSKLAAAAVFKDASSLSDTLGLGDVDVDELYAAMDWLLGRQSAVEANLVRRHLRTGSLVLYDLTSTWFEGRSCPLARVGYSRDGRPNSLQIVIGLLADREGRPLAVEVFPGNTADPSTVPAQVERLMLRHGLERVVVVGDRGTLTQARIRLDLQPRGLGWVTSLRAPAVRKLAASGTLQMSLFDQRGLAEITDCPDYPGERLIVCLNPLLRDERARKRDQLLRATERELDRIALAAARPRRPLKGREKIGLRVGRVLGRFKMAKHFHLEIGDASFRYRRNQEMIDAEADLDGVYVVRTNVAASEMDPAQTVQTYKDLSLIERAFRCLKTVDLNVRPIHHRLEERVRAHVFLCMLAYYVEWHMRRALAPLLFDDQEPEAGRELRPSVVAPAQKSPGAKAKASAKKTPDGLPVHSFQGLLAHLATLCRCRVSAPLGDGIEFVQYTSATELQRRAFQLLGFSPTQL